MTQTLKPYSNYTKIDLPWLNSIPSHWEIRRGKYLFNCIDIRSATGEEELLTVSSEKGIIPRKSANVTMFKAESYVGYKLCWPGDLVINSLWAWARGLGVSNYHGIISSAYGVYRLKPEYQDYSRFIHELVRSVPFQWELQVRSKGIWISRLQLTDESFLEIPFPFPPPQEQTAVVRYLNYMDRRINRYIKAKKKLIELLTEQKQAIIHQAVTRGLEPNVRLKPSGVEWLGDIPEHWKINRLKILAHNINTQTDQKRPEDIYIALENVEGWTGKLLLLNNEIVFESQVKRFRPNDVIFGKLRPYLAKITRPQVEGVCVSEFFVLRTDNSPVLPEFLEYKLRSFQIINLINSSTFGAKMPRADWNILGNLEFSYPPTMQEQKCIVNLIQEKTTSLQNVIDQSNLEMTLLREYRSKLIADVVTGKIDVSEIAANLPDEMEEDELIPINDDDETEEQDLLADEPTELS